MQRISADDIQQLLTTVGKPLEWDDLVYELDVGRARDRRELSKLLNGMIRNGIIGRDQRGCYHLLEAEQTTRGVLERSGRGLSLDGRPVPRERRSSVRAGDEVEARIVGDEVRILRVVSRSETPLIGILMTQGRYAHVESLSPEYKGRLSLAEPPFEGRHGDTVACRVIEEDRRGLVGVVTEVLTRGGGVKQASETMLANFGVPREWPEGVAEQVAALPRRVNAGGHHNRRSLVDLPLVTIDGETARDFDDAVYAEKRRGGWRVVVAIADVGHYVKAGSALDDAAWDRGNSVYLPDQVVPMLPEALSNELCSLKPKVPRLTLVCDMTVSNRGRVTGFEFYEAVIRSWQRLTYTRVQEFLDSGELDVETEVCTSLTAFEQVYQAFRRARDERAALDFDTHESRLEIEDNHVVAIHPQLRVEATRLIEEAMIAANVCAALFLEEAGGAGLYRVHEAPSAEKAEQLRQAFAAAGVRLARGDVNPQVVRDALDALGQVRDRWLFEYLVLRSLTQAVYSPENKGHFGLALGSYMHFTSPIRRYADLVVHRAIKAQLNGRHASQSMDYLVATGTQTSMTERRADEVAWGVDAWLKCEYVAERRGEVFEGVVMGVTEFGLFVELRGYFVQGLLHISALGADYFQFRPQAMSLVGERSGRRFVLGDHLQVILQDVVPEQGKLDLILAPAAGKSSGGQKAGQKRGAGGKRSGGAKRQQTSSRKTRAKFGGKPGAKSGKRGRRS